MENASKALIIAGAILISILLITIGIVLINSGRDVANSGKNAMSSSAIQAFNSQFTQYEGNNKSYNEVKQLLNTVISSNASHTNQVAVKLHNLDTSHMPGGLMDSSPFRITNPARNSFRVYTLNQIITALSKYPNNKFDVTLYYPSKEDINYRTNKPLNPVYRMCFTCRHKK